MISNVLISEAVARRAKPLPFYFCNNLESNLSAHHPRAIPSRHVSGSIRRHKLVFLIYYNQLRFHTHLGQYPIIGTLETDFCGTTGCKGTNEVRNYGQIIAFRPATAKSFTAGVLIAGS